MTGETFGQLLRRVRVERAISQNELARRANIDPSYVNRFERVGEQTSGGKPLKGSLPGRAIVLALAEALDLTYAERDRLLFVTGLAPEIDWQSRCEDAEAALQTVREAVRTVDTGDEPISIRRAV